MDVVELSFKYKGAIIEGYATPEEDYNGWTYSIALDDNLSFRIYYDDNEEWVILRDKNAISPEVDDELIAKITQQIQKQRMRA